MTMRKLLFKKHWNTTYVLNSTFLIYKDGERIRRGLEINLEDEKVQRNLVDELAPKKLTLQLDTPIFSATDAPSIILGLAEWESPTQVLCP